MLWNASAINGYAIAAKDGSLGSVSDFLFDDESWLIRWLIVDTGKWLSGRKVLLPPSVLGHPDPESREFSVRLTKQEVKDSPDIATDRPVSRQMEAKIYDHYGWYPYWGGGLYMGGYIAGYGYRADATARSASSEVQAPRAGDCRCSSGRRRPASPQHRDGHRVPYPCQRRRDRSRRGLPRRGCRLEHPLPRRRYDELVAREEGADLATLGSGDQLEGQAREPRCRSSERQEEPAIRSSHRGRPGL